ncbi:GAF domain-containing protein [Coleofasciculus sp. FACHB-64]|uniref:GAF domain-containing protein n=1 Tax=Cyanophyceae TaxID=3028117 RepID=UPI0016869A58|nr:GAF domain-containing protein [Coleofasciculus sp. FACHB-501]MBD1888353.1 GAF domain-containing protein [Coleofasciculus sp. FACHB-SPT9]MBD1895602.1 GAF domain-containing protein [Coleofasciculus sp. FACHB-129]MBD2048335.1 GAF domain-containing protein [Coleofasciculus sp. FACHB-64]
MQSNFNRDSDSSPAIQDSDPGLRAFANRLANSIERDVLVQKTTDELRDLLQVDRVVLYYFYRQWKGQVTFESLRSREYSIFGSTGPDDCFNDEYAALYQAGRVRAIADIELEPINPCHRDFLRTMKVRANLVVPILNSVRLWGLLVAHNCQDARTWTSSDLEAMQKAAETLATAPSIRDS